MRFDLIQTVDDVKGILWGSQLKSIFGVSETHCLCSLIEKNKIILKKNCPMLFLKDFTAKMCF